MAKVSFPTNLVDFALSDRIKVKQAVIFHKNFANSLENSTACPIYFNVFYEKE